MNREQIIVRTSIMGIFANVFLAAFKAAVGVLSGSIAVVLDAVNNLSDALSSVITIIGTRLAGKQADKKHPYGYGRIEILSAVTISVIVLYAGVSSLVESVKKIITPETPDYTVPALAIIAAAVVVKILLGRYVKTTGERVKSDALIASGEDARLDSIISASTLVAAGIYLMWQVSLEAWLGAVISVVIIKSGLEMLRSSISQILGERTEREITRAIQHTIVSFPEVSGAYDLVLHDYGPNTMIGAVHIEVPDTMGIVELARLERQITEKVMQEHQVILAGISIYVRSRLNSRSSLALRKVRKVVMAHENVIQMHGFFFDEERKELHFDIIIDYSAENRTEEYRQICSEVQQAFPEYRVSITLDADVSD